MESFLQAVEAKGFCSCAVIFWSSTYQFPSLRYMYLQQGYQFNTQIPERVFLSYVATYTL